MANGRRGRWLVAWVLLLACGRDPPPPPRQRRPATPAPPASLPSVAAGGGCPEPVATITLPGARPYEHDGRTAGASLVPTSGCRTNATGPEAVYALRIERATGVVVTTDDPRTVFDTILSVRRACAAPGSELACDDDGGNNNTRSVLRTYLEPGTYALLVDGFRAQAGAYHLRAEAYPAVAHSLCARARALAPGQPVEGETTAGGGVPSDQCRHIGEGGQLFYAVRVPAGRRVRLAARPVGPARWTPVVRALDACAAPTCVEIARAPGERQPATITVANTTGAAKTYVVSVSSLVAAENGAFDVSAELAP